MGGGLPPRFDPSVEDSEYLAAHRELILSAFDPADLAPFKITRTGCLAMNNRLVEIAEESTGLRAEPQE